MIAVTFGRDIVEMSTRTKVNLIRTRLQLTFVIPLTFRCDIREMSTRTNVNLLSYQLRLTFVISLTFGYLNHTNVKA